MLALNNPNPANTRPDEHTGAVRDLRRDLQARLGQRLLRSGKGKMNEAPHLARFLLVHEVQRVKVLDLAGERDGEAGGVEALNGRRAAGSCDQVLPHFGGGVAHTAYQPEAGNDNSTIQWLLAFRGLFVLLDVLDGVLHRLNLF